MIRNILIITVIAALVPTAMSSVSASADAEIALFSRASVDTDSLSITGNGDSAKMELKATNDNGKSNRVSGFQLTADNVLSTEVGDKVTVIDNVDFTKAITTDTRNNQKAISITSNGVIDFAGYNQGVYTLDVVVDDDRAYEAIIAIGYQTNQIVDKEITRVNSDYRIEFVFPPIEDPQPPKDIGLPYCDLVSSAEYKAGCFDRQDCSEDTLLCSCRDGSEVEDWRDCKDAGEHPAEQLKRTMPKPEPDPKPIECSEAGSMRQGDKCVEVGCLDYVGNPCHEKIKPGNPDAVEEIIPVEEELPLEELPVEEELGENTDDSEGSEDSGGSDDSEGSEDSGGSDDSEGSEDSGGSDSEGSEDSGGSDSEGSEDSGGSEGETSE
jgi:hypothetical protein